MEFVTIYHAPVELTFEEIELARVQRGYCLEIAIVSDTATNVYGTSAQARRVAAALGLQVTEIAE